MKNILFFISLFFFQITFSQVITFECDNEIITVSVDEVMNNPNAYMDWNDDNLIDENDYLIYLLAAYGCDDNDNDWGGDDDNVNEMNCEEGILISVDGGSWQDEVSWTITDCDGVEIIAEGGAPYENCVVLPEYYVINIYDSFGDGWNGIIMYIDGIGEFTLESGAQDAISNSDDCVIDDDNANEMNCEEGVLISVDGGFWQDEVSWTITDCDCVEIIAQGGAPYEDCVVLPENYVIIMNDFWGDGWNGNYMTIGDAMYTLEYGPENVIAVGDCDIDWWDGNNSDIDWEGEWNTDSYFTYECNGEIVTVTFNDTTNTILDFNGDGIIDSSEILFYVSENYDCDEVEINIVTDIWDDIIWNDSNWDLDTLNWDDDFDWDINNDGFDDFTWDDFDWDSIWDDYMFSDIDWENTPWGFIIDLGINPEDLINYLIELGDGRISAFDWRDFIDYFNNTLPLDLENNILNEKYVIQSINILGQIVDPNSKGVVFKLFNDGSVKKEYILK